MDRMRHVNGLGSWDGPCTVGYTSCTPLTLTLRTSMCPVMGHLAPRGVSHHLESTFMIGRIWNLSFRGFDAGCLEPVDEQYISTMPDPQAAFSGMATHRLCVRPRFS